MIQPDLSHTPGIYYALAYWMSATFYIQMNGSALSDWKRWVTQAGFLAAIGGFMILTDGVASIWFFPCMTVSVELTLLYIRFSTGMDWMKTGYFCVRAFILGEFSASLEWYLFYFGITVLGLPLNFGIKLLFLFPSTA